MNFRGKLRLLLGIGILILVSVYWFQPLRAQTTDTLDIEDIKTNPEQYRQLLQNGRKNRPRSYQSQPIFSPAENLRNQPNQSGLKEFSELGDSLLLRRMSGGAHTDTLSAGGIGDVVASDKEKESEREELRPFGLDFFANSTELNAPIEIPNSADYVLGPGDNIIVYLWGTVERELNLTVDREGNVQVPPIGAVSVWGQTLSEFEETLRGRFSATYTDFEMNVTLGSIRSIRVYVIGEVQKPGAYTVSSLTTLLNALYKAGGPTERGSFRSIKLLRGGKLVSECDLYTLLVFGDNSVDVRLQSGDAVFVPVTGPRVAVDGEVRRPALYELRGGETASDALAFAGGAEANGYLERVLVERLSQTDEARFVDINLSPSAKDSDSAFVLIDGDRMTVRTLYDVKRNYVSVGGMVKHPGRYERKEHMTLSELLNYVRLRPDGVYRQRANVFRTYPDDRRETLEVNLDSLLSDDGSDVNPGFDIELADRDSVHIYAIDDIEREKFVFIDGEVRYPGKYPLYDEMKLSDLIFLAGGVMRAAFLNRAEIARTDSLGRVTLTYVDLTSNESENTILLEDDQVYIRQIPEWELNRRVTIEGEVKFPGEYALVSRDETLWQALQRAGGFTDVAFPEGLSLERPSISSSTFRRNLDRIVASSSELREDSTGEIRSVEQINYDASNLNRIILDMKRLIATNGAEGDVTLQPGDRIFVPQIPPGISVLGAVGASGTIKYEPDKKPKYYLERAGGFTKQSDKDGIKLVKADGRVFSGDDARKRIVDLGDAIIVPTEIKRERNTLKTLSAMMQIVSGLATSAFILTKL